MVVVVAYDDDAIPAFLEAPSPCLAQARGFVEKSSQRYRLPQFTPRLLHHLRGAVIGVVVHKNDFRRDLADLKLGDVSQGLGDSIARVVTGNDDGNTILTDPSHYSHFSIHIGMMPISADNLSLILQLIVNACKLFDNGHLCHSFIAPNSLPIEHRGVNL